MLHLAVIELQKGVKQKLSNSQTLKYMDIIHSMQQNFLITGNWEEKKRGGQTLKRESCPNFFKFISCSSS